MDQIFITGLTTMGIIGVNEQERLTPQKIRISLALFGNLAAAGKSDNFKDSVDYKVIAKQVLSFVASSRCFTVEALAGDLAGLCLEYTWVQKVRVRVEKPGAIRFSKTVGAEIERRRRR